MSVKVSGFTIARNVTKYDYPIIQSIKSILPICDEFVVNVGDSQDQTLEIIKSINSPKIKIIQNKWDLSLGKEVLSYQTNLALRECKGDWAFYLQSDEVVHQLDLKKLRRKMEFLLKDTSVDSLRFQWFHFYGSFFRYRIDRGWYQKQDRIIRNNDEVISCGDAYGFKRRDGKPLRRKNTGAYIYHYGWVHSPKVMTERRVNAERIGFTTLKKEERTKDYLFGTLDQFAPYFGSHPSVMKDVVAEHEISQRDQQNIKRKYFLHPMNILKIRYKTGKRVRERLE